MLEAKVGEGVTFEFHLVSQFAASKIRYWAILKEKSINLLQKYVLTPDLWNVLYDELLKIQLSKDMEIIEFSLYAFSILVVSKASVPYLLEEKLDMALRADVTWM